MKNHLFLFILFFLSFSSQAQIRWGFFASPNISFQDRTERVPNEYFYNNVGFTHSIEDKSVFGYSVGLTAFKEIGKHLELQSGITYSNFGFWTDIRANSLDLTVHRYFSSADGTLRYQYLGIPLEGRFFFSEGKFAYLSLGITNYFMIASKYRAWWPPSHLGGNLGFSANPHASSLPLNKYNLALMGGVAIKLIYYQNFQFFLQPTIEYMLRPQASNVGYSTQFLTLISETLEDRQLASVGMRLVFRFGTL